jgi:hypothetical protein
MKLLDKIVLNRLISLITNFILGVLKIVSPKTDITIPKPPRKKILPWRNKDE